MKPCVIPAPAPCANTNAARAAAGSSTSAETRVASSTARVSGSAMRGMRDDAARPVACASGLLGGRRHAADVADDGVADRARARLEPRQEALRVLVARDQLDALV